MSGGQSSPRSRRRTRGKRGNEQTRAAEGTEQPPYGTGQPVSTRGMSSFSPPRHATRETDTLLGPVHTVSHMSLDQEGSGDDGEGGSAANRRPAVVNRPRPVTPQASRTRSWRKERAMATTLACGSRRSVS